MCKKLYHQERGYIIFLITIGYTVQLYIYFYTTYFNMANNYITREEATEFVKIKLGVDLTIEDRYKLLTQIITRFFVKVPFQNLSMMAVPFENRKIPTLRECIESVLDGSGGVCFALNFALMSILNELDYKASLQCASVGMPETNDHAFVLVENLKKDGDRWLVDVGFGGSPCFRPVSLDFEKESESFTQSHVTFKFQKRGGFYLRLHKLGQGAPLPIVENGWQHAYYFTLGTADPIEIWESVNNNVYRRKDAYFFHNSPRVMGYDSDLRAVHFKESFFLKEYEDGQLQKEDIEGDVAEAVHEVFPAIERKTIKAALAEFERISTITDNGDSN